MKHEGRVVYGGVDTHQDVHVAAVIDDVGMLLGTKSFPTHPNRLDDPVMALRRRGRIPGQDRARSGLGIDRVGLALRPPQLTIGPA